MQVEILARPANAAVKLSMSSGERITAEGGAMIAMSADMNVETSISKGEGGLLKSLARTLAGEGLFLNHFTAGGRGGELYLATTLPGDMEAIELDGSKPLRVQSGSFVAHSPGINMDVQWGGMKNMFSGENMLWLEMTGTGTVIINAFGAIYPVDVNGEYIVDTGNIAAFEKTMDYTISKAGKSALASFMGGEGFVCKFKGTGRVWCQTHSAKSFGTALTPHLRPRG